MDQERRLGRRSHEFCRGDRRVVWALPSGCVPKMSTDTPDEAATMETISPNYATARLQTSGIQGSVGLRFTELKQSSEIPSAGGRQVIYKSFPNYWET